MAQEDHPIPSWIVIGAGKGRHVRDVRALHSLPLFTNTACLADPEASVFHRHLADRSVRTVAAPPSLIEGIGRPRCEPSFIPELIDRAYAVSDAESIAAARVLLRRIGRSCGGSTGTNLWAAARIVSEMETRGEQGSVATLLCDSGERYRSMHLDDAWLRQRGIETGPAEAAMERFFETGIFGQSVQTP
jgi:cysteine synthase A